MTIVINCGILPYFISLIKKKKTIYFYFKEKSRKDILILLEKFFKKNKINFKKISNFIVILNDQSFTRLRSIITIVNIFQFFFNLSVSQVIADESKNIDELIKIGQKKLKRKTILPIYHKEPNINLS